MGIKAIATKYRSLAQYIFAGFIMLIPASASAVTYDLSNGFSANGLGAGFIFTEPGDDLLVDFENGTITLSVTDIDASTGLIQLVGTGFGQYGPGGDNPGTFTANEGFYDFNFSFTAARSGNNYIQSQPLANAGTITNPTGQILSFPLTVAPSEGYSFGVFVTGNNIEVHGWAYGQQAGGDFHFFGSRTEGGTEIPEPTAAALLLAGLAGIGGRRRLKSVGQD